MPDISRGTKVVAGLVVASASILGAMSQWEGDETTVYADKLAGGLPTVCSGHTDWKMKVGSQVSEDECSHIRAADAAKYGLAIIQCSGHTADHPVLNQHQFDALTLFAINVGVANACGSRAMALIKAGDAAAGCDAIAQGPDGTPVWSYTNHGARFVRGLYNRRLFERAWCLEPLAAPQPQVKASA
jgi:GH24 family phage-related lysozyme (muramidase)